MFIDFDWFYYISTVHLNMTENEFWRSTPKKVGALWNLHMKFNGLKFNEENEKEKKVYIDEVPFL